MFLRTWVIPVQHKCSHRTDYFQVFFAGEVFVALSSHLEYSISVPLDSSQAGGVTVDVGTGPQRRGAEEKTICN